MKSIDITATRYGLMYAIAPEPVYTLGSESNLWSKSAFHAMVKRVALLEHVGMAEDIANMAIYLASPAGDHVTAATRVADGSEWLKKLWNKENGMHDQCHEQGLGKISRRCFLSAAASAAGFALAGPALAERMVRPSEGLDNADVQSQSSAAPSPLTVSCPDCCRALPAYRSHA